MIVESGTPLRRAALMLHAMTPADCEWMLRQLPVASGERLRQLLGELADLGIPRDATLLKQLRAAPAAVREPVLEVESPPAKPAFASTADAIAAADPAHLATVLREEPAELVAMLLSLRDWPWREALLRQIGPLKARHIMAQYAGATTRHGSASERVVLEALLRRLHATPAVAPLQPPVRALPAPALVKEASMGRAWLMQVLRPLAKGLAR